MKNNKKQTGRGAWRAPALIAMLSCASGCAYFGAVTSPTPPTLYVNWKSRNIQWDYGEPPRVILRLRQPITLTKLSDGEDALEIKCNGVRYPEIRSAFLQRHEAEKIEAAIFDNELGVARAQCLTEAARQCRLFLWDGRASFALLDVATIFLPDQPAHAYLYVRCLTSGAFKEIARSPSTIIADEAVPYWAEFIGELPALENKHSP